MIRTALDSFGYALVALLVIFDPAGTAALFAAMTPRDTPAERREQAVRACAIAFVVLTVFGLAGEALLRALGIGLPAMRVAGGILLFIAATGMVTGRGAVRETEKEREEAIRTEEDISVFPLAIPLIAGPGAMTTMVVLHSSGAGDILRIGALEVALIVAIFVQLMALVAAPWVARALGPTGSNVIGRVLGVLLAALAAQIALDGLHEALHI